MIILGINAYHGDSSACLVKDGQLIAAAEEERFRRIKHWAGFPSKAIASCLSEGGVDLSEVDHIAINRNPRANVHRKAFYALAKRPELQLVLSRYKNAKKWASIKEEIDRFDPNVSFTGKVHFIEHHLAHLGSAFYVSPFDESVVVSVDGFGDFSSACWGVGRSTRIKIDERVYFPHSLGIFYQALTQYLGFPHYGDEYKVMGLAPYGKPKFLEEMRQIVHSRPDGTFKLNLSFFRHHIEKANYTWQNCAPTVGRLFLPALEELLGPSRKQEAPIEQHHKDIARSVQAMYEEICFNLLNVAYERHKLSALCLAGGCAMNSVANGKIQQNTPFREVYIQSAAGDAGGGYWCSLCCLAQTK